MPPTKVTKKEVTENIARLANKPELLMGYLHTVIPALVGPVIDDFSPRKGFGGSMMEIRGRNFAPARLDNEVTVGGKPALVVKAEAGLLRVITHPETAAGPVKVKVGAKTAAGPEDFTLLRYPAPEAREDGPPIFFAGRGQGLPGDVPGTGTLRVLVVLVNPSDRVPANAANTRNTVVTAWDNVHTFYDQASYARLDVDIDVTANWHTLTGNFNDYVSTSAADRWAPNIRPTMLDRLTAEAAQAAQNAGFNLDNYAVMAVVMNLNGTFIRAWGGWARSNFSYNDGAGTNINITVNHDLNLLAIQETATWGRCAHELGHNIVSAPSGLSASPGANTLGEDVYASDLVDPGVATAQAFEIMGNCEARPLFSAYHMEKLGYYNAGNILNLQWDRNAFSQEYEVAAHALAENVAGGRYHLIKIRVADGLYYYIEVRQRPGATVQIFDDSLPLDGAPQQGGVVVTKVFTDRVNMNQQMRFITLLHDVHVLKQGDTATDPLRALKITVVNDHAVNRPLVCRVRVEWAQGIADDPAGAFDLRVEPWDNHYQTPDIWVDRIPYGAFDQARDAQGRPLGNGDKPRPNEINQYWARVHCDGTVAAANVRLTFYAVEPPGVGDNGNWGPIQTKVLANISNLAPNNFTDAFVNWVPAVGRHTCLKVQAEPQLGEITGGNNFAQENVFDFEAPASSVPDPVIMPVAVRNPLNLLTRVLLGVNGVPNGYTAHFPHRWVWLRPLEERRFELTVIPSMNLPNYGKEVPARAKVRLAGDLLRSYDKEILPGVLPPSRMFPMGGVTYQVTPKKRVTVNLKEDKEQSKSTTVVLTGSLNPALAGEKLRVDLIDPLDRRRVAEAVTDAQGRFKAKFDLLIKPNLDVTAKKVKEKLVKGTYKAQAFVINSPKAAQAESGVVIVSK